MWNRLARAVRSFIGFFISVAENPELIRMELYFAVDGWGVSGTPGILCAKQSVRNFA